MDDDDNREDDLEDELETQDIISSCPLCVFNYRYVNYKTQSEYKSKYITDYLLKALKKE